MISIRVGNEVAIRRLTELFDEAGWSTKTADMKRLEMMVENSHYVVTAWDDKIMIGFARCTYDNVFNGQINNVVVDSKYRNKGIGKKIVTTIIESNPKVTYILRTEEENEGFYKKIGFKSAKYSMMYERKE